MLEKWIRLARLAFSIRKGTDVNGTIEEITDNIEVRGSNIWLLICSAILASIGLDLNSTAVIIGAMLISPLMSPILGVGLGIAILDRPLITKALGNLVFATTISLLTSFIYFTVTPLGELTEELSARTMPTILDVGVAFFGGIAGIVANSREKKTSAIPGVAIATALMPPLCTAGFGIAKFDSAVFLGAFYLFILNAFFISLATYLISVWLKFPRKAQIDVERQARVKQLIIAFALLISIPSAVIFLQVLAKLRFDRGVRNFVSKEISNGTRQSVRWEINETDGKNTLRVFTVGSEISPEEIRELSTKMSSYGINDLSLNIIPMNVSVAEFRETTASLRTNIMERLRVLEAQADESRNELEAQKAELDRLRKIADPQLKFAASLKERFTELEEATWGTNESNDPAAAKTPVLRLRFNQGIGPADIERVVGLVRESAKTELPGLEFEIAVTPPGDEVPAQQPTAPNNR